MNKKIESFLLSQSCMTIATIGPYCATCFYAYEKDTKSILFKSKLDSTHIENIILNNKVAGTIHSNKQQITSFIGIQFTGIAYRIRTNEGLYYYTKYPLSIAMPGELWSIDIHYIKMVTNTLGIIEIIEYK